MMIFHKHLRHYYAKYSWLLLLGVAALFVVDWAQLQIPVIYGTLIDALDTHTETTLNGDLLWRLCTEAFGYIAILVVGRFAWRICFFNSANGVEAGLREQMFRRSVSLSQQYYQRNKVGDIMSLYTNDLDTINEWFGDATLMFFDALILGVMALVKMFRMNWKLSLLVLIPTGLMVIIGTIVSKYMQKKWEDRQEAFSQLSDFSQESFSGIAVIKAFVTQMRELMAFARINRNNEDANVAFTKASVLLDVTVTAFVGAVISIILGYGGYLVYRGHFTMAQLVMFISYFTSITWPVMAISFLIEMYSRCRASLVRISNLLDEKVDVSDREGAQEVTHVEGQLRFNHLTFRYPDGEYDALHDVTFEIQKGQFVGVIGNTGSGKTTLVDLLLRTYNVPDGTIFVDGMDVNDITIRSLRRFVSYVPQDNFLFSDTMANNISFAYGEEPIEDERIQHAARMADIHDNIVQFSEGYQTVLGERGVTISGGQKQRTSIARALLKEAAILLLDDALSAVDTKTEETILTNLRAERAGKTTLLIAHRVSTVKTLDCILYMEDGVLVDMGTHDELYERCPGYHKTVELQRLEEESHA